MKKKDGQSVREIVANAGPFCEAMGEVPAIRDLRETASRGAPATETTPEKAAALRK